MDKRSKNTRKHFNSSERKRFLEKSNNVCAHCGKPLNVHTMTTEHALPVSKGGKNDDRNLIALCDKCNPIKSNKVIIKSIPNYFKYLNKKDLNLLLQYANEYNKSLEWFSWDNWFEDDVFVDTPIGIPSGNDWIEDKDSLKSTAKTVIKKATYNDLQGILNFYLRKGKDYSFMKNRLYINFMIGAVYGIYNSSSEVVGAFTVAFDRVTDCYSPVIDNVLYSKKYYMAMRDVLSLCIENIKKKIPGLVCPIATGIFYKDDVCNILDVILINKPHVVSDEYITLEARDEIKMYLGFLSRSNNVKASIERSLDSYCKVTEKGYKPLIEARRKEVRSFVSKDVYKQIKEYL